MFYTLLLSRETPWPRSRGPANTWAAIPRIPRIWAANPANWNRGIAGSQGARELESRDRGIRVRELRDSDLDR